MADNTSPPTGLLGIIATMRAVYAKVDEVSQVAIAKSGHAPACTPGCSHCCQQLTTISVPEGLVLAAHVLQEPEWRDWLPQLRAAALADCAPAMTRRSRLQSRVPCGLLDPGTNLCRAYAARPACCRLHVVVTPPQNCSADNDPHAVNIMALDLTDIEGAVWQVVRDISVAINDKGFDQGPVSLMLLHCMEFVLNPDTNPDTLVGQWADHTLVSDALRGLPEVDEWMREHALDLYNEENENAARDPRIAEQNEKLYTIGKKVFGVQ